MNNKQIILVEKNKLYLYNKIGNKWIKDIETNCEYGKNGYSRNRHEGDFTTPIGSYPLLFAFGTEENPGTKLEYKKITKKSYYSENGNQWIESNTPIIGEHLIEYPKEYHYAISIGFNTNPFIQGKGSSIFLHCKGSKGYTAGCIAVEEAIMLELLKKVEKGTYIKINHPRCNF